MAHELRKLRRELEREKHRNSQLQSQLKRQTQLQGQLVRRGPPVVPSGSRACVCVCVCLLRRHACPRMRTSPQPLCRLARSNFKLSRRKSTSPTS